jgi:N-acyl-L-homoserine lactone synthetase
MIIVVDSLNKHRFDQVLDEMFRLRARVFGDRLGWNVSIRDGMEIDQFDDLDPGYVIGLDADGHVVSCARVLQTTGPHMLADVFSDILDGEPPLRSATIWESTRFCVDTQRLQRGTGPNTLAYATFELMIGTLEFAKRSGISDIITVIDPVMDRLLKRSNNAPYGYVGSTKPMGKVSAMAALLDCTDERIDRLRRFAQIDGDVHLTEDEALAAFRCSHPVADATATSAKTLVDLDLAEPEAMPVGTRDIIDYCRAQILNADSPAEMAAAMEIVGKLSQTKGLQDLRKMIWQEIH